MPLDRILGIDPGSRFTGYGCIDVDGSRYRLVAHGRISCPAQMALAERLALLCRGLRDILEELEPSVAVLEQPFHGASSRSLIVLAQARGALLATLGTAQMPVAEYSPAAVKKAVTGNGRADKQQVTRMVRLQLGDSEAFSADAADALAVAMCFAAHGPLEKALAATTGATFPKGSSEGRKSAGEGSRSQSKSTTWHAQESP